MAENPTRMTRRAAIKRAVALVGGTLTASQLSVFSDTFAAVTDESPPKFLNKNHFAILSRIADLVIPETETPGALAARVPHFIDMMLADWASPQRQARYVAGLDNLDSLASDAGASSFLTGTTKQQMALLLELDKETFAGNADNTFFGELKKMVLFAYYSSEAGATLELRFARIPVNYEPCVPLSEDDRAWFWSHYNHGL